MGPKHTKLLALLTFPWFRAQCYKKVLKTREILKMLKLLVLLTAECLKPGNIKRFKMLKVLGVLGSPKVGPNAIQGVA